MMDSKLRELIAHQIPAPGYSYNNHPVIVLLEKLEAQITAMEEELEGGGD